MLVADDIIAFEHSDWLAQKVVQMPSKSLDTLSCIK